MIWIILVGYSIIAIIFTAVLKVYFYEPDSEELSYYDNERNRALSIVYGIFWPITMPITIIILIVVCIYYPIEKLVRKIYKHFQNKSK